MASNALVMCGEDITNRKDDRRVLQGSAEAQTVVHAWQGLLELIELEEDRLIAEALIAEDVSQEMCRKCFSGFGRYMRLQSTLKANILKAVHSQVIREAQECLRKSLRLDTTQSAMSYQQSQKLGETSSPSVLVRKLLI